MPNPVEKTTTAKLTLFEAGQRAKIAAAVAEEARRHVYALLNGPPDWRRTAPATGAAGKFTVTVEYQP